MSAPGSLPKTVPFAFVIGIIVWSTTPLGIVWSSEHVHPTMAVLLRMLIALVLGALLLLVLRIRLPLHGQAQRLYAYSTIGIVGGMLLSYFAARYLPSGTMSLIFGLSPLMSGLLSQWILKEAGFGPLKLMAFFIAFLGLGLVCFDNFANQAGSLIGVGLILTAMSLFSLSGVLIKTITVNIHPLATTVGSLAFSMPFFMLTAWLFDANMPVLDINNRSLWAIVYLGIFGSLVGFIAYFYILQYLPASTVTLVTLITPIFALMLGSLLNHEPLSQQLVMGAALVVIGLGLFQFGHLLTKRWRASPL
ncbi:DMT family transporter [Shewanella sp. NIFS-20-20]|uniref:DMT family transporter n=1 Tax=Shewanella sp. NIFS-20-20 TaxID=2853806 RepID=UPI001C43B709|nr:DMT family transporter [Shewanella sp. NIFS-20-20]MBV7314539.1 DMT family transporter [Shewanella sp. NIFS-20-20]